MQSSFDLTTLVILILIGIIIWILRSTDRTDSRPEATLLDPEPIYPEQYHATTLPPATAPSIPIIQPPLPPSPRFSALDSESSDLFTEAIVDLPLVAQETIPASTVEPRPQVGSQPTPPLSMSPPASDLDESTPSATLRDEAYRLLEAQRSVREIAEQLGLTRDEVTILLAKSFHG